MHVKKTKKGKFSIELSRDEREKILRASTDFLFEEGLRIAHVPFDTKDNTMRHLYCSIISDMAASKNFNIHLNINIKMLFSRTEAIAIMWLLRSYDNDIQLIDIKGGLHKLLSR